MLIFNMFAFQLETEIFKQKFILYSVQLQS